MSDIFPLDVNQLVSVLDYLNIGVYVTDRERRILLWNRKAQEITGYRAEDVVGKACHEQVLSHVDRNGHPLCSSELCPLFRAMTLDRETRESELVYARKADGGRVAVSVSAAPLRDASGKVVGGIEAFSDETARVRDLEFAQKIQQHLLPKDLPESENIRFDVRYYPHDLVGGDFYDVREVGPDQYGVLVADVRGHGVSAALYTMWLKSMEEGHSGLLSKPVEFLSALNAEMSQYVLDESFATALYGVLDAGRNVFSYCNAGHPPPLHFHASSREVTELESHGMPLGIMADGAYDAGTMTLEKGDRLLFYTDGATEVTDKEGKMLGPEGLAELLKREVTLGDKHLLERLYRRILDNCGEVALSDDVLLLSLEVLR